MPSNVARTERNLMDSYRRATELHDAGPHAHRVAEQHGKQDYLTGHEQSRQALENSQDAHHQHLQAASAAHGIVTFGHAEIAARAYELWQARGCPDGSSEEDWFDAAEELRSHIRPR